MKDAKYGRYNSAYEQPGVHTDDKLVLGGLVLDDVLPRQLAVLGQQDGRGVASHPDHVHHQGAAQEVVLGVLHRQIQKKGSSKVVEQVAIRDEDRDCSENYDERDWGSNTSEDDDVGEEGRQDEYQCPGSEIHQEDGQTE